MGISKNAVCIISWLKRNHLLKRGDSVAEIGSQQINNDLIDDFNPLDELAKLFAVSPFSKAFGWKIGDRKFLDSGMQHLPEDAPFSRQLYEHLGLKYACVDLNDSPGTIRMDLNFDQVPKEHLGKYALVTNLGTTEHMANQMNAFKAIHDFTAKDGFIVHTLPFQGFPAHGFLTYSMQFFWMLCRSNLYKVIDVNLTFWNRYKVPDNVLQFAREHSAIFKQKDHIAQQEFQDVGVIIVLQKQHDIGFVPPIDVPNGTLTDDALMKKRYWTVLDRDMLDKYLRQGPNFFKNAFGR